MISPYARRGAVDSMHYSTVSMIRSIGILLGFDPMSQFDASATPMDRSFTVNADLTPYTHVVPEQDIYEMNPALALLQGEALNLAKASMKLQLEEVDAADMKVYNEILWKAIKGKNTPLPRIVHDPRNHGITKLLLLSQVSEK